MSNRKKQAPGMVIEYATDKEGNPAYHPDTPPDLVADPSGKTPIDDDRYRIQRTRPNRKMRRIMEAQQRRAQR